MTTILRTRADDIPRGRWGKPLIIPPGGGEPVLYHRPSTIAKVLDDQSNLLAWYGRQAIKGVLARPELLDQARSDASDDNLKKVAAAAHRAAGSESAADTGTLAHELTDQFDAGMGIRPGPFEQVIETYGRMVQGLEMLDRELFVVGDELRCAGSMDRLIRTQDGTVVVADLKTGRWAATYGARAAAVQVSIYANSQRYDPATGERQPLHPDLDTSKGLLIHLPQDGSEPGLYWLDLNAGHAAAQLAMRVRACRSYPMISDRIDPPGRVTLKSEA